MQQPDPRRPAGNRRLITMILGAFVVAILAIGIWGGIETSSIDGVPEGTDVEARDPGSSESRPTGGVMRPENSLTDDPAPANNPVATE